MSEKMRSCKNSLDNINLTVFHALSSTLSLMTELDILPEDADLDAWVCGGWGCSDGVHVYPPLPPTSP